MFEGSTYRMYPLGDFAVEICFGDRIDPLVHQQVISLWDSLRASPLPGQTDLAPAYTTLSIHFDRNNFLPLDLSRLFSLISGRIETIEKVDSANALLLHVPVCYGSDHGPDMETLSNQLGLSEEEIINMHCSTTYRVYALGFLPGFPYMGELPSGLRMPRKQRPDPVTAGTVAIASNQTGIYPSDNPGGWWRIGKTPFRLFDPADPRITWLMPGDQVCFHAVDSAAFAFIERSVSGLSFEALRQKGGWS